MRQATEFPDGAIGAARHTAKVAVLMATKDGEAFLDDQLRSLADQTHTRVDIWVSDDGSSDGTLAILDGWRTRWSKGRFTVLEGPKQGFAENFRALTTNAAIDADYFAFCDQDDIWMPDKLERAISWLEANDSGCPLLFCTRTLTISEDGTPLGQSPLFSRTPSFRNALVQSLAGGNTMVFNRVARRMMAMASARTSFVSHDWWAYLIVTGVGGRVHYSSAPLVRYRQHSGNEVGANTSWRARCSRLRRLYAGQFVGWTDSNLSALERNRDLLTVDALQALELFHNARKGNLATRIRNLQRSGVYRQRLLGTLLLWPSIALGLL